MCDSCANYETMANEWIDRTLKLNAIITQHEKTIKELRENGMVSRNLILEHQNSVMCEALKQISHHYNGYEESAEDMVQMARDTLKAIGEWSFGNDYPTVESGGDK